MTETLCTCMASCQKRKCYRWSSLAPRSSVFLSLAVCKNGGRRPGDFIACSTTIIHHHPSPQ